MSVDPNEAFASDVNELNPPHDFARFKGRPRRAVEILYRRVDVDYETPSDRLARDYDTATSRVSIPARGGGNTVNAHYDVVVLGAGPGGYVAAIAPRSSVYPPPSSS